MPLKPMHRIGLIGSGFMGRAHNIAYGIAEQVFGPAYAVERLGIADIDTQTAKKAQTDFGFAYHTANWRELIEDPRLTIIDITAPNHLHFDMTMAAIAAGKHVYCEKPLAPASEQAREMRDAAQRAGVITQVGFNYIKNPLFKLAKTIIESGEIGEIYAFRGIHAEDYMADPDAYYSFRHDPKGGGGALADLGSHVLATARYLLGSISEVLGECRTLINDRPTGNAENPTRPIMVDDVTHAFLRFESGATGTLEANWLATGRKMQHDFAIYGSKGGLVFSQERLNELQLYKMGDNPATRGFRTIVTGTEHPPYGKFCVAGGHQLGFNDLKAIEIYDFLSAIDGGVSVIADFDEGFKIQKLVEAIQQSSKTGSWIKTG